MREVCPLTRRACVGGVLIVLLSTAPSFSQPPEADDDQVRAAVGIKVIHSHETLLGSGVIVGSIYRSHYGLTILNPCVIPPSTRPALFVIEHDKPVSSAADAIPTTILSVSPHTGLTLFTFSAEPRPAWRSPRIAPGAEKPTPPFTIYAATLADGKVSVRPPKSKESVDMGPLGPILGKASDFLGASGAPVFNREKRLAGLVTVYHEHGLIGVPASPNERLPYSQSSHCGERRDVAYLLPIHHGMDVVSQLAGPILRFNEELLGLQDANAKLDALVQRLENERKLALLETLDPERKPPVDPDQRAGAVKSLRRLFLPSDGSDRQPTPDWLKQRVENLLRSQDLAWARLGLDIIRRPPMRADTSVLLQNAVELREYNQDVKPQALEELDSWWRSCHPQVFAWFTRYKDESNRSNVAPIDLRTKLDKLLANPPDCSAKGLVW